MSIDRVPTLSHVVHRATFPETPVIGESLESRCDFALKAVGENRRVADRETPHPFALAFVFPEGDI
jgi:hypothetical protein